LEEKATPAEVERFKLLINDIILTKDSETPDDIAVPSIVKETFDGLLCGYHLMIMRCNRKIDANFLIWALRDASIVTQFHREAVGITRYGLAARHFKNAVIAFPDKKEQKVIAKYLDVAIGKIDKLISNKAGPDRYSGNKSMFYQRLTKADSLINKQILCLQQYRKSLIHECVTGKRKVIDD
jgi:type I restriction enzyme S subunit